MRTDEGLVARTRALDPLVRGIAGRFPLLSAVTPKNAAHEQARLFEAWSRGQETSPRWEAPEIDRRMLVSARRVLDEVLASLHREQGWLAVYRARFVELALDLTVLESAFTPALADAANARFADDDLDRREADALSARLRATATDEDDEEETIATDDPIEPRSLVSRMRARISELHLPVRVLVRERVGSLAAAGDGVVIVAANKRATARETERVVVHEVDGHVLPRERGRQGRFGIETLGSAGASEDEEGRALILEERHGLLGARRRRSLVARHLASRIVEGGGTYVDVVRAARELLPLEEALSVASRVMRGGHVHRGDVVSGLARERVYLAARARVGRAVEADPGLLDRLGARRLSLTASAMIVKTSRDARPG